MILVGMTGGSGSGKSTVARHLQGRGFPVIDCDRLYHSLIEGASPCTDELIARFGRQIEKPAGGVDRTALSRIVFSQDDAGRIALADLNAITHKHVKAAIGQRLSALEASGSPIVFLDAPTLIESGIHRDCDFVLAVCADKDACLSRIMARDALLHEDAANRIASQKPLSYYAEYADLVIENSGSKEELLSTVDQLLCRLLGEVSK